jgi:hypothetical protein
LIGQLEFEGSTQVLKRANYTEKKEGFMQIFQNLLWTPSSLLVKLKDLCLASVVWELQV